MWFDFVHALNALLRIYDIFLLVHIEESKIDERNVRTQPLCHCLKSGVNML